MASEKKAPSADTLRTHRPAWRYGAGEGCGAMLELPDWPTGGFCGETGKICADCSAARNHVDVNELVELCTRIQQNAHAIPVRVNLGGKWESKFLSEMPAELAVWWALQFVLRRLLGPVVDKTPAELFATHDEAGIRFVPDPDVRLRFVDKEIGAPEPPPLCGLDALDDPPPPPPTTSILVDVAEVAGARVVKLVLPAGAQSIALALPPDTAEALAKTLAQQARIARSPAGLILPRS